MKILAIESSCDETAAAVVEDGRRVISSVIASQVKEHILYGGVVPEIASRRHAEAISGVVGEALDRAEMNVGDVDAIAVTYAPGLIGALLVGVNFAKGLAFSANKPLVPVHHLRSHIAANYITHPDLEPPFLALVVSGGHSHIIEVRDYTDFHIIGRTRDDAAGEAMDKAARAMGLDYPGGVNLDRVSKNGDPKSYKLPRPHVDGSEYDFSFCAFLFNQTLVVFYIVNACEGVLHITECLTVFIQRQHVCVGIYAAVIQNIHIKQVVAYFIGRIAQHQHYLLCALCDTSQADCKTVSAEDGEYNTDCFHRPALLFTSAAISSVDA